MTKDGSRADLDHWAVDKRINIGLLLGMFLQLVGFGWYAAKIDSRVEQLETRSTRTETRLTDFDREARDANTRLIRLEEKSSAMLEILRRVERVLDPPRRPDVP